MGYRDWDLPRDMKSTLLTLLAQYARHRPEGIHEVVYALLYDAGKPYANRLEGEEWADMLDGLCREAQRAIDDYRDHFAESPPGYEPELPVSDPDKLDDGLPF